MKTSVSVLLIVIALLTSCQKESVTPTTLSGTYKITSLVIDGNDLTAAVSQFTVSFNANGKMMVSDSMNTYNCGWSEDSDMMDSDMMMGGEMINDQMGGYHFDMMGCPDNSPMHMLNTDWVMDSQSDQSCSFHEKDLKNNVLLLERV